MRVVISRLARRDLAGIADYIVERSPSRALPFIKDLEARCKAIGAFPEAARRIEGIAGNARMLHHRGYLILYRIAAGEVSIVRIWHGARNIDALIKDMIEEG